jgi:hypothetical protein
VLEDVDTDVEFRSSAASRITARWIASWWITAWWESAWRVALTATVIWLRWSVVDDSDVVPEPVPTVGSAQEDIASNTLAVCLVDVSNQILLRFEVELLKVIVEPLHGSWNISSVEILRDAPCFTLERIGSSIVVMPPAT